MAYDISLGGPPLRSVRIPAMGIHAVAQCGDKTYFLQGAPEVRFNELREHDAVPIGPIWDNGEPPAIFAQPMFCVDDTVVAVMMRGGSPAKLGHFSINVVRISLVTGQPTYIGATAMRSALTSADLADAPREGQYLKGRSILWGDAGGHIHVTSIDTGETGTVQTRAAGDKRLNLMWRFLGDRAVALDDSAGLLTSYSLDGNETARIQIPQLRELLSAGEDATDFVLVDPALLT